MPEMDGYRVTELIKATELGWSDAVAARSNNGKLKTSLKCVIVAVTAYTSGYEERAKKVGISEVI
jgi:CheY-like chemotaxis protein